MGMENCGVNINSNGLGASRAQDLPFFVCEQKMEDPLLGSIVFIALEIVSAGPQRMTRTKRKVYQNGHLKRTQLRRLEAAFAQA